MPEINVIRGIKYKPDMLIRKVSSTEKYKSISCRYVDVLYSPCWIFAFGALFRLHGDKRKYVGYLSGVDELSLSPGTVANMPQTEKVEADDKNILCDKLLKEEAEDRAWEYSKKWIIRKNRVLFCTPERTETHCFKVYKVLYLFEFHNRDTDCTFYKAMDSLTGDLENIELI